MMIVSVLLIAFAVSTVECYWKPPPFTNWTWQLSGALVTTRKVVMYDVDLWDTPNNTIRALKTAGRKVICYFRYYIVAYIKVARYFLKFSAGSFEDWRPDQNKFPNIIKGNSLDGWYVEKIR